MIIQAIDILLSTVPHWSLHKTCTASVRYLWVIVLFSRGQRTPDWSIWQPAWESDFNNNSQWLFCTCAIIAPLSIQNLSSVANNLAPLSSHMRDAISWRGNIIIDTLSSCHSFSLAVSDCIPLLPQWVIPYFPYVPSPFLWSRPTLRRLSPE